ncbi:uncharacterized protein [Bombus fervidus]|uniref:uncharacterized protein n=1 Tax=Bombus fervidus TaxID=203811 RepID=UPI003D18A819
MTDNRCVCPRCLHPSCPLPYAEPPYDEVAHEIDNNFISVKIPKNRGKFEPEGTQQQQDKSSFDFNCADSEEVRAYGYVLNSRACVAQVKNASQAVRKCT